MNVVTVLFRRKTKKKEWMCCLVLLVCFSQATFAQLPLHSIEKWAQTFGRRIYDFSEKYTALKDIRMEYMLMEPVSIEPVDGSKMIKEMKINIEKMLQRKVDAVQELVRAAERVYQNESTDHSLNLSDYFLSKRINETMFPLQENQRFNFMEVNTALSSVHVPTNIFDGSSVIQNGVAWSKMLDETFVNNYESDSTLTWQYFCSTTGFLRSFPGVRWRTETFNEVEKRDTYDCRARGWYMQAAAYPKDIVILLDSSGSMKGLRSVVAKATVVKLLDTLGYDDYVNVITYSDVVDYLDSCFNGTMVQATEAHKQRLKSALSSVETLNIANLEEALTTAFRLLRTVNESRQGAQCNKAIMIITDGASDTYEKVFQHYNWPQLEVRVFTYLIGREVRDTKNVLWMACRNKGRLSHFSSLADVHEHFQNYVHVMSRPLAIDKASHPTWSNVYVDALVPGLQLMTTVAQPVFNTRPGKLNQQDIIGVAGTDVPLKELLRMTPAYKLGVNGYSFAITNNGYVLFHPKLNDQVTMEQIDTLAINIIDFEPMDVNETLRKKMIDQLTDSLKMKSIFTYDQKKRVVVGDYNYFITPIKDTPFSLGIALPQKTGLFRLNGTKALKDADLSALSLGEAMLAPWSYCRLDTNETRIHPLEMLLKYLNRAKTDTAFYEKRCDKELISSLLFDAEATRNAVINWRKAVYHDENDTQTRNERNAVELVFLGTKAGLTRYLSFNQSRNEPPFVMAHRSTVEATYYTRAVLNGQGIFTFSVPFKDDKEERTELLVTASTSVSVVIDGKEAVAAAVGLRMKYTSFFEMFMNSTRVCDPQEHFCQEKKCNNPEINCFLLDDSGYVVLSKDESEVGRFFGSLEGKGAIMSELLIQEEDEEDQTESGPHESGLFKKTSVVDYNAICDVYTDARSGGSAFLGLEPLRRIFSSFMNFLHEAAICFLQFNFLNWYFYTNARGEYEANNTDTSSSGEDNVDYQEYYEGLDPRDEIISGMMMECASIINDIPSPSPQKRNQVKACFDNIRQKTLPRIVGRKKCIMKHSYYSADPDQLPQDGTATSCRGTEDECANKFSVNRVPGTNLVLLVVDARCSCRQEQPLSALPVEILFNKTYECQQLQKEVYRRPPLGCHAHSNEEDYSECGSGHQIRPALSTLSAVLATVAIIPRLLAKS